jgi:colanic acid biosynthesis glycosyl transferase WcaI
MKNMRILLITQWFDPEPAFKGLIFAKELKKVGNEVEVITGFPNYPGGNIYPGYRIKMLQREVIDGIKVSRVPLYPSHNLSALGRAFNYISFALSSFFYGVFSLRKIDVIYVYNPPMTAALSAAFIGLFRQIPFVVDINDLWPDTLAATGMIKNKYLLSFIGKVCLWVYKSSSHIVVGTPGYRKKLIERGVPEEKIDVIYNWCDEEALSLPAVINAYEYGMDNRFNIVFAGTMGKAQALDSVIRAAKLIETRHEEVQFVFVGGGIEIESLKKLSQELHLENVIFIPRLPFSEIGKVLTLADALLVHLKNDPLFEITFPAKIQAYLKVGKPVIMGVKGDAASVLTQSGAGYCVLPENEKSIADAVSKIFKLSQDELDEMGARGLEYYNKYLSLKIGVEKFTKVFESVV